MEGKNINLLGLIGILGAIVMVIGVFLAWGILEVNIPLLGTETMEWSGWEIFNHVDDISTDADYAPIIALVCGVLAVICAIVPMFIGDGFSNIFKLMNLVVMILGIIAVVCMVMFYTGFVASVDVAGMLTGSASVGIGFWLCMVGGIITVLGGILPIAKKIMD